MNTPNSNISGTGVSRRSFVSALAALPASMSGAFAAGERVNIGVIGAGGRGSRVASEFLALADVRIVAVCDAYWTRRERRRREWNARYGGDYVTAYARPEQILARSDVDAVLVATPDHWHVPLWAMKMDHSGPSFYEGRGSVPDYGLYDTVDQWDITGYYPENVPLRFMSERCCRETVMKYRQRWSSHGNTFFGTEGWISVDRNGIEASSAALERIEFRSTDEGGSPAWDTPGTSSIASAAGSSR